MTINEVAYFIYFSAHVGTLIYPFFLFSSYRTMYLKCIAKVENLYIFTWFILNMQKNMEWKKAEAEEKAISADFLFCKVSKIGGKEEA